MSAREFFAWSIVTVLFIVLGITKQLDLQSAVTELGHVLLYRPDSIVYKQVVRFRFIVCVAAIAAIATVVIVVRSPGPGEGLHTYRLVPCSR